MITIGAWPTFIDGYSSNKSAVPKTPPGNHPVLFLDALHDVLAFAGQQILVTILH
jgi:hypothetical protein